MDRGELGRLWRHESETGPIAGEVVMQVVARAKRLDRALLVRDAGEVLAGLLVVGVAWATALGAPGWIPKVGAVLLTTGVAYPLARLLGARRRHRRPPRDQPLVTRLRDELARVNTQIGLLRSVRSWYLTPIALGGSAWALAVVSAAPVEPRLRWSLLGVTVLTAAGIFLLVGWVVERLNRRAAARQLEPYRDELAALLDELEAT